MATIASLIVSVGADTVDLIKGVDHPTNLYLIDNQALTLRKAFVKQSSTCSLCHPDLEH